MITVEEAIQKIIFSKAEWKTEVIPLTQSLDRVLAEDITADRDYPPFNRATMDGFAVRTVDISEHPNPQFTIVGEIFAGEEKNIFLNAGEAIKIMTGAPVPASADAVIKKEDAVVEGNTVSFTIQTLKQFQSIARQGEDLKKSHQVLEKYVRINVGIQSLLASLGKSNIAVMQHPRVAIISTGNEIQPISAAVNRSQIRDSNTVAISGFLQHYGITPDQMLIVKDSKKDLIAAVKSLLQYDLLILSGGVSAGDADFVPDVLQECGVRKLIHSVKIKPGKPLWFGVHSHGLRVFALPGNPFSVHVACKIFIESYLRECFHLEQLRPLLLPLRNGRKRSGSFNEFFPAKIITDAGTTIEPMQYHSSGDITAAVRSDGIGFHPESNDVLLPKDVIQFYPWRNLL